MKEKRASRDKAKGINNGHIPIGVKLEWQNQGSGFGSDTLKRLRDQVHKVTVWRKMLFLTGLKPKGKPLIATSSLGSQLQPREHIR